jgi:nucleoside-diphosphate-sugar epimerase
MVGKSLLPMLAGAGRRVIAYSRTEHAPAEQVEYRTLESPDTGRSEDNIRDWICLAPIWTLPQHFGMLAAQHAGRIVALSSTSVLTKQGSSDPAEQQTAAKLVRGERELIAWAEANGIEWVILRPTLIYGGGQDRNISEIARFIRRFGFFPLFGEARGLRQPVHAQDVATASMAVLLNRSVRNRTYEISGAERLSYREMVSRVFSAMGKPPRYLRIPLAAFRLAILCLKVLPRFRSWSAAMAERMNADLVFDHAAAADDFGYSPRPFRLDSNDLPIT